MTDKKAIITSKPVTRQVTQSLEQGSVEATESRARSRAHHGDCRAQSPEQGKNRGKRPGAKEGKMRAGAWNPGLEQWALSMEPAKVKGQKLGRLKPQQGAEGLRWPGDVEASIPFDV